MINQKSNTNYMSANQKCSNDQIKKTGGKG